MSSILIVNHGFLGDGILASSFAENCKFNGFDQVDMLIGFPQLLQLLRNNPNIDNVYIHQIGSHPQIPEHVKQNNYDIVYTTDHLIFNERPIDTFNKSVGLSKLKYEYDLYVPEADILKEDKPLLAFQYDWSARSHGPDYKLRDVSYIVDQISQKYNVYFVGGDTHYNINQNTPIDFLRHCALIQSCDLFFGYPGGMHWVAGGVRVPTVCTSEHVVKHYTDNGEFKNKNFLSFCSEWMVHTSKHFNEKHILLEPFVSDDFIVDYLMNLDYESLL